MADRAKAPVSGRAAGGFGGEGQGAGDGAGPDQEAVRRGRCDAPGAGLCPHRGAMTEGVAALVILSPHPSPTSLVSKGNGLTIVGGGFLFLLIISFSKGVYPLCIPHGGEPSPEPPPTRRGSGLGCRLGRSWTVPTGHQDPPCTPKGVLSSGSPFYFVFLGSGACLPLWGRRCPVGTVLR